MIFASEAYQEDDMCICVFVVQVLAERGQLKGMVESAKKRVADERARESGKKVSATA
jgi:hypothetical protein